jgi:hypothetical protein
MSKVECTAVNELVDLARTKPLDSDDGDADLFGGFANAPRAARLRGTPAPSLFEMPALPPPPAPVPQPVAPSPEIRKQLAQHAARAIAIAPLHLGADESASTSHVARYVPLSTLGRRFALPIAALVGLGIITGIAYTRLAHHGSSATTAAPSPVSVALAAEAAVPPPIVVAPVATAEAPAAKLVDIRLDSSPAGASATLLSNGVSTPLGTTPVDTSIDPTKQYDVVFALAGKPSQVEHFDPSKTQRVQVVFPDSPAPAATAVADAKPAKSSHHSKHAQAARVAAATAPARSTKSTKSGKSMPSLATPDFGDSPAPTKSSNAAAGDGGNGSLAITSSAPAAILLDDANTGFMTPHTLSVPAGHHNIRLIAATAHVNKLVQVDVSAHKTTRINPF